MRPFAPMRLIATFLLAACLTSVAAAPPASAQTAVSASPKAVAGGFGSAMAVSGDQLLVGDPSSVHAPGRVVVYRAGESGWTEAARLQAGDASVGDGFGTDLAVHGDRLVVGAPSAGAVYVFEKTDGAWTQTARLAPAESTDGQFGAAVAASDGAVFAGVTDPPFTFDPGMGGVVVFEREGGEWMERQTIVPDDATEGDRFGTSLVTAGDALFAGAPRGNGMAGAVYVITRSGEGEAPWTVAQTLAGLGGGFGTALAASEDASEVLIGAPRVNGQRGGAQVARRDGDRWRLAETLWPFDAPTDARFGSALAIDAAGSAWVGAPGVDAATGALYRFDRDADGAWTRSERMAGPDAGTGQRFAGTVAASAQYVAAGQLGVDYGAYMSGGSVVAVYDTEDGSWRTPSLAPPSRNVFATMTGETKSCSDGQVEQFDCKNVDLLSFLPIDAIGGERGVRLNDVWGWTDPETGRDYALVGRVDGTAFVDVTDPHAPVYVGELPKTEGSEAKIWRDVKVYQNHAFVVADNAGRHGMQVFDLTQLRDVGPDERPKTFEATARYDGIHSAHNVFINEETGFAYVVAANGGGRTCGGGLHMVNVQEPTKPTFAGCFADPSTGRTGTGTTHDTQCIVYDGPDADYQGREVCFSSNETAVSIADVTDKSNPKAISTVSHPKSAYVHQGWLTDDRRYLYVNDELDEMSGLVDRTRTLVFDVVDLDDPQLVREFFLSTPASDHNLYVRGSTMYQANYTSGLRVVDISDPENPREVGHFDTLPYGPDAPGFEGAFSNYPYFESGVVVVTSMQEGLFLLKKSDVEL